MSTNNLYYTIQASAGENGLIEPSGEVKVRQYQSKTFFYAADIGYTIDTVEIDNALISVNNDEIGSYTFQNVQENYAIHITFKPKYEQPKLEPESGQLVIPGF